MTELTLAVAGGGVFTARLCEALVASEVLPPTRIRLTARRQDRLGVIAKHCQLSLATLKPGWMVTAEASLQAALAGADAVILLMRVGGAAARLADETFPRRFGLSGDEGLGPGGIANALRTLPVLEETSDVISAVAPGALVLNMMAPLGVTTRLLTDKGLNAVGVCELPLVTEALFEQASSLPNADRLYAGFNHLGWFWPSAAGSDAHFFRTIGEAGLANQKTIAEFNAAPLRYYYEIFDPPAAKRLGFQRSLRRAAEVEDISERCINDFTTAPGRSSAALSERPTPWFDQALVPVLEAYFAGRPHQGFLNFRNGDLIPGLPADVIVELRAAIAAGSIEPAPCFQLPSRVRTFLQAIATWEQCTFQAGCTSRKPQKQQLIKKALAALPYSEPVAQLDELTGAVLQAGSE